MSHSETGSENERPLITFALFAYNQEQFIVEAVQGALSQTYSPLEIIISDDCSPDNTYKIIEEEVTNYVGQNHIIVRRNEKKLGLGEHVNTIMKLAKGELIVVAAGDDVSLPHRTERLWQEFLAVGNNVYSIFSNEQLIDEYGNKRALGRQNPPNPDRLNLEWFTNRQASVTGSSQAWQRDIFDFFGPLDDQVVSEDVVIPYRALLLGSIHYIHEPLVLRRYTGSNLSLGSFSKWNPHLNTHEFHDYSLRHARNFQAVYETRLLDIDKFVRVHPERQAEVDFIRAVTQKKLYRTQAEVRFWESLDSQKLYILIREFIKKGFQKTAARLLFSWVFPRIYMRCQHFISVSQRGRLTGIE